MRSIQVPVWFLMICFIGPLVLLGWAVSITAPPIYRRVAREGSLLLILALVLLLPCRILTGAPLIGPLFSLFLIIGWMLYIIAMIAIIAIKRRQPERELPFLTYYAQQWGKG